MRAYKSKYRAFLLESSTMLTWDKIQHSDNYLWRLFNDHTFIDLQYTGLKDSNGVEIYEGDIIERRDYLYEEGDSVKLGVVTFNTNNYGGLPAFHLCNAQGESIEYYYGAAPSDEGGLYSYYVIGNIYENPELLEDL